MIGKIPDPTSNDTQDETPNELTIHTPEALAMLEPHSNALVTRGRLMAGRHFAEETQARRAKNEGPLAEELKQLMHDLGEIAPEELSRAVRETLAPMVALHNDATKTRDEVAIHNRELPARIRDIFGLQGEEIIIVSAGIGQLRDAISRAARKIHSKVPNPNEPRPKELPTIVRPGVLTDNIRERWVNSGYLRRPEDRTINIKAIKTYLERLIHIGRLTIEVKAIATALHLNDLASRLNDLQDAYEALNEPPEEGESLEDLAVLATNAEANLEKIVFEILETMGRAIFEIQTSVLGDLNAILGLIPDAEVLRSQYAETLKKLQAKARETKQLPNPETIAHIEGALKVLNSFVRLGKPRLSKRGVKLSKFRIKKPGDPEKK
jgi:hypothetical protein